MKRKLKVLTSFLLVFVMCFGILLTSASAAATYTYTKADYLDAYNQYFSGYPNVSYGSTGVYVEYCQSLLSWAGFYNGEISGKFDSATQAAVREAQRATYSSKHDIYFEAISADGICGPYTWGKLVLME